MNTNHPNEKTNTPKLTPAELKHAREWILECQWRDIDSEEDLADFSDAQVERGIQKHFCGGIAEFKSVYCNEDTSQ